MSTGSVCLECGWCNYHSPSCSRGLEAELLKAAEPCCHAAQAMSEAYAVVDELAPEWSGSGLDTILRAFLPKKGQDS